MTGSITDWLALYQTGDRGAVEGLWNRYYKQLVRVAHLRLNGASRSGNDEEDVALSAFACFCSGMEAGRFPNLLDRNDLWRLLLYLTAQKAIDARRRQAAQRRRPPSNSHRSASKSVPDLAEIVGREPSPEFCFQAAESLTTLLNSLNDAPLRQIAVYKMEGYTVDEIANRMDCSRTTIERKLKRIRHEWAHHMA